MKIVIGNDHVALEMKNEIKAYLENLGHEIINVGTDTSDSTDYPLYANKACELIKNNEVDCGILICGTGVGISIAANKNRGIRAVVCSEPYSAKLSRAHNNTNVLCFGARVIGTEMAKMIVDSWLEEKYEGNRHQKRVEMILEIENNE